MHNVVLLGDSILDNAAYTAGGPAVIAHVRQQLPPGWRATLNAVDGATTDDLQPQLASLPPDASHLLLSIGGNNALLCQDILETPVTSSGEALLLFYALAQDFELAYRGAVQDCLKRNLPLVVCTIYHGNFPDPDYQRRVAVALTVFNDVIIRIAVEMRLKVIDLRSICNCADDYANPIEPSGSGGAKIARAIVLAVTEPASSARGANVVAN
ncbi:SGNH/GDSL hydrolase family protein [Massilia glaciei]|uniref:SGNH/GDSL hydrolase family protein n=1 Tax=Massilia glaciei TaxID=1524097 RepID=A0A2U2I5L4_9BURK|nr:SGNH/GDSL hydrolase family protein [Massilia glaciei]PWF55047.1 SGNH/GDSL hydrolase family protein [Massilia glaciei]